MLFSFKKNKILLALSAILCGTTLLSAAPNAISPQKSPVKVNRCGKKGRPTTRRSSTPPKYTAKTDQLPLLSQPVYVPLCCDGVRSTLQQELGKRNDQMPPKGSRYCLKYKLPIDLSKCHSSSCKQKE